MNNSVNNLKSKDTLDLFTITLLIYFKSVFMFFVCFKV